MVKDIMLGLTQTCIRPYENFTPIYVMASRSIPYKLKAQLNELLYVVV